MPPSSPIRPETPRRARETLAAPSGIARGDPEIPPRRLRNGPDWRKVRLVSLYGTTTGERGCLAGPLNPVDRVRQGGARDVAGSRPAGEGRAGAGNGWGQNHVRHSRDRRPGRRPCPRDGGP